MKVRFQKSFLKNLPIVIGPDTAIGLILALLVANALIFLHIHKSDSSCKHCSYTTGGSVKDV